MIGDDKPLKEIDDTAGSAAADRFEEIIERIKAADADINEDEEAPLYIEMGSEEAEIGVIRTIRFNLKNRDFQITRTQKEYRIVGQDRRKSLEKLSRPIIEIKLKMKPDISNQWIVVDLENLF